VVCAREAEIKDEARTARVANFMIDRDEATVSEASTSLKLSFMDFGRNQLNGCEGRSSISPQN
jgi:hypothetical protein